MRRRPSWKGLFVSLAVVCFVAFLGTFEIAFQDYREASYDRLTANTPAETQDALWMDRHAKIQFHDSVVWFIVAQVFLLLAVLSRGREGVDLTVPELDEGLEEALRE